MFEFEINGRTSERSILRRREEFIPISGDVVDKMFDAIGVMLDVCVGWARLEGLRNDAGEANFESDINIGLIEEGKDEEGEGRFETIAVPIRLDRMVVVVLFVVVVVRLYLL